MQIVHQTGERDYNAVRTALPRQPPEILAEVVPFLTNMAERFAWAELAGLPGRSDHCRGGSRGRPRGDFQSVRARHGQPPAAQRADHGPARKPGGFDHGNRTEPENDWRAGFCALLDQPWEIETLSTNARRLAYPHAASDIVNLIEEAARQRGCFMSTQIKGRISSSGAKAHDSRLLNVGAKAPTPNNALGRGFRIERNGLRA